MKSGPEGHVMTFPFHDPDTGRAKSRTGQEVVAHSLDAIQKNTRVSNSYCDLTYLWNVNVLKVN